jgi:hypothetical protein
MIWVLLVLLVAGCGMSNVQPEAKRCYKIWNKETQRIDYECEKVSQSTRDGER